MKPTVLAVLPNAGLGNKLFVWAKAEVFAHLNDLDVLTVGWAYPKMRPLLRGERSSRMYARYFRQTGLMKRVELAYRCSLGRKLWEPPCARMKDLTPDTVCGFRSIPHWRDYFVDIRDHRDLVVSKLYSALHPNILTELDTLSPPGVAMHVRRGDFRALKPGENFAHVGGCRTPDEYFVEQIQLLRQAAGFNVPVTIFSDATTSELSDILSLPAVTRSAVGNDMQELLLMSRSRIIFCSAGSTFSEWSGYLSRALIIRHPDHVHGNIRSAVT